MDELLEQFLIEGRELVVQAGDDCAALADGHGGSDILDSAFRAIHTLKGSAAIVGLGPMEIMLHAAEDLLGAARSAGQRIEVASARALVACIDQCDRWLDAVAAGGELPPDAAADATRIIAALHGMEAEGTTALQASPQPDWARALVEAEREQIEASGAGGQDLTVVRYRPREDCFFSGDDPIALAAAIPQLVAIRIGTPEKWPALDQLDPYRCVVTIDAVSSAAEVEVRSLFRLLPDQVQIATVRPEAPRPAPQPRRTDQSIRVEPAQIDRLLDLVGELLVSRNQFGQLAIEAAGGSDKLAALRTSGAAMDRVLREMHRGVMAMRLVPLDRIARRVARLVRETAERLGREVDIRLDGLDTRIDKAVADALFDPLLHVARNALDHGVEPPAERQSAGKPASGRLTLSAWSSGQQVVVELADDGRGIDPATMRRLAAERGLLPATDAAALSDDEAIQVIFAPGFSTASQITDLSGRGVGMDAVRNAVERLGGRTLLHSRVGEGTSVSIHLPASAALTSVLTITVGGERYAVPMEVVEQTVRVPADAILPAGTGRAFVLRERTVPLLELSALLGIAAEPARGDRKVLVVESLGRPVGLAVDDFSDRSEVILRPMTGLLSTIPVVSGTTLTGDGSVLFILDLPELIG
jgi:two-component system chemotaxis sensor kinase CheA